MKDQIFISYAKEDRAFAINICEQLKKYGFHPWLDVIDLLPGQEWRVEIKKAIREARFSLRAYLPMPLLDGALCTPS
jgi:hypothetical protein